MHLCTIWLDWNTPNTPELNSHYFFSPISKTVDRLCKKTSHEHLCLYPPTVSFSMHYQTDFSSTSWVWPCSFSDSNLCSRRYNNVSNLIPGVWVATHDPAGESTWTNAWAGCPLTAGFYSICCSFYRSFSGPRSDHRSWRLPHFFIRIVKYLRTSSPWTSPHPTTTRHSAVPPTHCCYCTSAHSRDTPRLPQVSCGGVMRSWGWEEVAVPGYQWYWRGEPRERGLGLVGLGRSFGDLFGGILRQGVDCWRRGWGRFGAQFRRFLVSNRWGGEHEGRHYPCLLNFVDSRLELIHYC